MFTEAPMRQTANLLTKVQNETVFPLAQAMPVLLGVNTLVLFGLDRLQLIPSWVKLAATIFLGF